MLIGGLKSGWLSVVLVCFAGPQQVEQAWITAHPVPKTHCPVPHEAANRNSCRGLFLGNGYHRTWRDCCVRLSLSIFPVLVGNKLYYLEFD